MVDTETVFSILEQFHKADKGDPEKYKIALINAGVAIHNWHEANK